MTNWEQVAKELAYHLYDIIDTHVFVSDPDVLDAIDLMHNLGFVDEDGDWIYDD